ncbi:MAG: acyl carrier protein [Candidatus Thiodiazotropha endolucinida]|nr:acyl carrier protein [Candidatus Thiodiazotropha endolucinida]
MGNRLNQQKDNRKTEITADALLSVIQGLIDESPDGDHLKHDLTLDCRLEHDLGLDSLARTELVARINKAFAILLPDEALLAETNTACTDDPAHTSSRDAGSGDNSGAEGIADRQVNATIGGLDPDGGPGLASRSATGKDTYPTLRQ